jgi:hypothetical protein
MRRSLFWMRRSLCLCLCLCRLLLTLQQPRQQMKVSQTHTCRTVHVHMLTREFPDVYDLQVAPAGADVQVSAAPSDCGCSCSQMNNAVL